AHAGATRVGADHRDAGVGGESMVGANASGAGVGESAVGGGAGAVGSTSAVTGTGAAGAVAGTAAGVGVTDDAALVATLGAAVAAQLGSLRGSARQGATREVLDLTGKLPPDVRRTLLQASVRALAVDE